jgi:hypothetical protein
VSANSAFSLAISRSQASASFQVDAGRERAAGPGDDGDPDLRIHRELAERPRDRVH